MIDLDSMNKLSRLTKIKLPEHEIDAFISKLQNVMDMINTLKDVNTDDVEPLTSAVRANLHLRKDEVNDGGMVEDLFTNVPGGSAALAREIKCYVVPKVVE